MRSTYIKNLTSCSFCGKNDYQVDIIIVGPDMVGICNECVEGCNNIISKKAKEKR